MTGPIARHADDKNRIPRAELISVITEQMARLMDEVGRALKSLGFTGQRGQQIVLTGGGAELAGLADYAQAALGKPVRIGRPLHIKGLPEAHGTPGFSTLTGLVLYAAADPIDIRKVGRAGREGAPFDKLGPVGRIYRALREYF